MSQWVFLQGLSDVWQPMLGYFTSTRNSVPSAHMHSLYLSKPSSKYTSPAELGIRVALNITDPLRMMLFSCKGTKQKPVRIMFVSLASHPPSHTKPYLQGRSNSWLTALSSMSPPILNSTVRPIMLTPSFPRTMALPSPLMFRSVAALLVIYTYRKQQTRYNAHFFTNISDSTDSAVQGVKLIIGSPYYTHPLCGSLFHTENFDSFGQMKLMVIKICAEECGLRARVCEGYADITDNWGLVLLYAQFRGALLEHNLKRKRK